jgi:signal transduction histidine kinase
MMESFIQNFEHTYSHDDLLAHVKLERNRARLHSLSEVSELVLHDLTNPLAVVKFCIEQLETNPNLLTEKPHYLEKLKTNLDRAFDIIDSFRTVVRRDKDTEWCRLDACHKAAVKIIQSQLKQDLQSLIVDFDPSLEGKLIQVPQFDAVFILDTIYRILLFENPHSAQDQLYLEVKNEGRNEKELIISLKTNSMCDLDLSKSGSNRVNLFNLRAIHQQLVTYGGHVGSLDKSLTDNSGTILKIGLPSLDIGT